MLNAKDATEEFRRRTQFVVILVTGASLLLSAVWIGRTILLLFFAAALCALLLTTTASWVSVSTRLPRTAALLLIIVSVAGSLALMVWLHGSAIAEQLLKLRTDLPLAVHNVFAQLQGKTWGRWLIARLHDNAQLNGGITFAMSRVGGALLSTASVAVGFVIVGMASLYLAAEPETYFKGIRFITPSRHQIVVERCLTSAAIQLRWWLLAKFASMTAVGVLIFIGLWLLGIPLAGVLGAIAACLTFIPNVGPILSAIPAGLLAFAISPTKGLLTLSLFCVVHFVEGNFVTPLAERQIVKLPPALTLAVQLFLGSFTGALGVVLAAPLTAAAWGVISALLAERGDLVSEDNTVRRSVISVVNR